MRTSEVICCVSIRFHSSSAPTFFTVMQTNGLISSLKRGAQTAARDQVPSPGRFYSFISAHFHNTLCCNGLSLLMISNLSYCNEPKQLVHILFLLSQAAGDCSIFCNLLHLQWKAAVVGLTYVKMFSGSWVMLNFLNLLIFSERACCRVKVFYKCCCFVWPGALCSALERCSRCMLTDALRPSTKLVSKLMSIKKKNAVRRARSLQFITVSVCPWFSLSPSDLFFPQTCIRVNK